MTPMDATDANEYKDRFIESNMELYQDADKDVLTFISQALYHAGLSGAEAIGSLFGSGYCFYFAHMLKEAFGHGTVCCTGTSHIVWLDGTRPDRDIAYDIHGVCCDYEVLIPVSAMGKAAMDFRHVPGQEYGTPKEEIDALAQHWKGRTDLRMQDIDTNAHAMYLIRRPVSEDDPKSGLWWLPGRDGYTSRISRAGIYTAEEAANITASVSPKHAEAVSLSPEMMAQMEANARAIIREKADTLQKASQAYDEAREALHEAEREAASLAMKLVDALMPAATGSSQALPGAYKTRYFHNETLSAEEYHISAEEACRAAARFRDEEEGYDYADAVRMRDNGSCILLCWANASGESGVDIRENDADYDAAAKAMSDYRP